MLEEMVRGCRRWGREIGGGDVASRPDSCKTTPPLRGPVAIFWRSSCSRRLYLVDTLEPWLSPLSLGAFVGLTLASIWVYKAFRDSTRKRDKVDLRGMRRVFYNLAYATDLRCPEDGHVSALPVPDAFAMKSRTILRVKKEHMWRTFQ